MALISFPPGAGAIGLSAFQKLREYRRLHELSWDESLRTDDKGKTISRKERGRKLCDQKANSVADIAAVLGKIGTPEGEEIGLKGLAGEGEADGESGTRAPKVEVKWNDLLDAQFAESWTENVIHDRLEWKARQEEEARLAQEKRVEERVRLRKAVAEKRRLKQEATRAEKEKLHLATKAEKHAKYLETRGITEAQHQREVQELLKAKAERQKEQALPLAERQARRAERERLAEQARVEADLRLQKEKAEKQALYLVEKAKKHAKYLAERGITEEEYTLEREELARVKAEKKKLAE